MTDVYSAHVRHLHSQLAPMLPIEAFVEALDPVAMGLQSANQFYAPVQFAVQISGPISAAAGAVRVQVPVHANPRWLSVMKQRFAAMIGMPELLEEEMDFRTVTGRSIGTIEDPAELHNVGKLNLYVRGELLRLPEVPAIPVEYSVSKLADIERWMGATIQEQVPGLVAKYLAPCKNIEEINAALRADGPMLKALTTAVIGKDKAQWAEFVRTRHVNSPMVLDPKEAELAAQAIAKDVLLDEVRRFVEAAAPQIRSHLAATESRALQEQAAARGLKGNDADHYAPVLVNVHSGPMQSIANTQQFYRELAEDMLSAPHVQDAIVDALYSRPMTSVGCRWHGETPDAGVRTKLKHAQEKLRKLQDKGGATTEELAKAKAAVDRYLAEYKAAEDRAKATSTVSGGGGGGSASFGPSGSTSGGGGGGVSTGKSSATPIVVGNRSGAIGQRIRPFAKPLSAQEVAQVMEMVRKPELSIQDNFKDLMDYLQTDTKVGLTVAQMMAQTIHGAWFFAQTNGQAYDNFALVFGGLIKRALHGDGFLTRDEIVDTMQRAMDAFYLKIVRDLDKSNRPNDFQVFNWLIVLFCLELLGADAMHYSKVLRTSTDKEWLPQTYEGLRVYIPQRAANQIIALLNDRNGAGVANNLLRQRWVVYLNRSRKSPAELQTWFSQMTPFWDASKEDVQPQTQAEEEDETERLLREEREAARAINDRFRADLLQQKAAQGGTDAAQASGLFSGWASSAWSSVTGAPSQTAKAALDIRVLELRTEMQGPNFSTDDDDLNGFLAAYRTATGNSSASLSDAIREVFAGNEAFVLKYAQEKAKIENGYVPVGFDDALGALEDYVRLARWPSDDARNEQAEAEQRAAVEAPKAPAAKIPITNRKVAWSWLTKEKKDKTSKDDVTMFLTTFFKTKAEAVAFLEGKEVTYNQLKFVLGAKNGVGLSLSGTKADLAERLVSTLGPDLKAHIEAHHPWNAQIHHTVQPVSGAYPAYYTVNHTKQDLSERAPFSGDLVKTYAAYHMFTGKAVAPAHGYHRAGCEHMDKYRKKMLHQLRRDQKDLDYNNVRPEAAEQYLNQVRGRGAPSRSIGAPARAPPVEPLGCGMSSSDDDERDSVKARIGNRAPPVLPLGGAYSDHSSDREDEAYMRTHLVGAGLLSSSDSDHETGAFALGDEVPPFMPLRRAMVEAEVPPLVPLKQSGLPQRPPTVAAAPKAIDAGLSSDSDTEPMSVAAMFGLPTLASAKAAKIGKSYK